VQIAVRLAGGLRMRALDGAWATCGGADVSASMTIEP
jgi:hypothetical protein